MNAPAAASGDATRGLGRSGWFGVAVALAVGSWLRFAFLDRQLLIGDELHSVKAAVEWSASEIARQWSYYGADYCIPLTLLYKAWMNLGGSLSEGVMRAPVLASAFAAMLIMPLVLRGRLGPRATGVYVALLALSPLLVLYGRIARSYMPAVLLCFVAVMCFETWMRTKSRRAAVGYTAAASLAIWFNLTALTVVAAPVIVAAILKAADRRWRIEDWRPLFALGAFAAVCVGATIALPLDSLLALREVHGRGAAPTLGTWIEVIHLHAGTTNSLLAAFVVLALLRGSLLLYRQDRDFVLYVGGIALVHVVGLLALAPSQLDNPIVINRYLLALLPFGLAFVALGLATPLPRITPRWQALVVVLLFAAGLASGPFARRAFFTSSFVHAPTFTYFLHAGNWLPEEAMPAFYRELAAEESSSPERQRPLVEYPWFNIASHAFDAYQKAHQRPLLVGTPALSLQDSQLALSRIIRPSIPTYLATDARWLIVHTDIQAEERRVHTSNPNHWLRLERRPGIWRPLLRAGRETTRSLEARWGPPDRTEEGLRVWDLDRLRALAASGRGSAEDA